MTVNVIYRKATIDDANIITNFAIGVIRHTFTVKQQIGPQEYILSKKHEEDYLIIRQKTLEKSTTISRIAIDPISNIIVGYIEFGPKNIYFDDLKCEYEILCFFVDPKFQGKGVGKYLLSTVIQEGHESGAFTIGQDSIGIMTMEGNQTVTAFYEKIGMVIAKYLKFSVSFAFYIKSRRENKR